MVHVSLSVYHRAYANVSALRYGARCGSYLMRVLWNSLPDKWQLCIGVFFAVLALTLPIFLLALDNRCVHLTACH